ncbi:hypothetical protein HK102_007461 [Quaeritorhiza haematococci]|nr:hypothetical protein HK102_007461 [Quaeritorhiza haematococci]
MSKLDVLLTKMEEAVAAIRAFVEVEVAECEERVGSWGYETFVIWIYSSDVDFSPPRPFATTECEQSHCTSFREKLDACAAKVEAGEGHPDETCVEEFFDMMECINHCAAPKLFSKLK